MAENERIPNELSLEYSKANAGCKKCGRTIKDGDLRAVKLVRSHFHEGYDARYFHYECGLPFADTLSDWNGLGKLAWRDVLKVASEYGVENPGLPGIQKQHEARLALSQQLQTYPKDELARILKHNGLFQCVKRGSHGLADAAYRIADSLLFGVLPPCPVCGERALVAELGDLKCIGKVGSSECSFAFRVAAVFDHEPLGNFPVGDPDLAAKLRRECCLELPGPMLKQKPPKVGWVGGFSNEARSGSGGGFAEAGWADLDSDEEAVAETEHRLKGFRFCITDEVFDAFSDLDDLVHAHGGRATPEVVLAREDGGRQRTTHVVTLSQDAKEVAMANRANIPVVSPDFVSAILHADNTAEPVEVESVYIRGRQPGKPNAHLVGRYRRNPAGEGFLHTNGRLRMVRSVDGSMWQIKPDTGGCLARAPDTSPSWTNVVDGNPLVSNVSWEIYDGKRFRADPEVVAVVSGAKIRGPKLWQRKWLLPYLVGASGLGSKMVQPPPERRKRQLTAVAPDSAVLKVHEGASILLAKLGHEEEDYEIYVSPDNRVFNATLQYTDVKWDLNKVYILQLLRQKDGAGVFVYRRWGRVGAKMDDMINNCRDGGIKKAEETFEKQFVEKTGESFYQEEEFLQQPGKYAVLEMESRDHRGKRPRTDAGEEVSESKLPREVQGLCRLIFDASMVEKHLRDMDVDTERLPVGQIAVAQMERAYNVLGRIAKNLAPGTTALEQERREKTLRDLTNAFYTQIPTAFNRRESPPMVETEEQVAELMSRVDSMLQIATFAAKADGAKNSKADFLVDAQYEQLEAPLTPVAKDDATFALVEEALTSTHGPTHRGYTLELAELFEFTGGELDPGSGRLNGGWPDGRLLWHGSRLANWVGVLSEGLRIAPPEAPSSGSMFGKGVYFADVASKSANYCGADRDYPEGLLLLCEVDLGEQLEKRHADPDSAAKAAAAGCGSVLARGQLAPTRLQPLAEQTLPIAMGPVRPAQIDGVDVVSDLKYNEYVVYDTSRIIPRYLVRARFNFAE